MREKRGKRRRTTKRNSLSQKTTRKRSLRQRRTAGKRNQTKSLKTRCSTWQSKYSS